MARRKKKKTHEQQAWLDWLNDDKDVPEAAEHRNPVSTRPRKVSIGLDGMPIAPSTHKQPQAYSYKTGGNTERKTAVAKAQTNVPPEGLNWRALSTQAIETERDAEKDNVVEKEIAINIHLPQMHLPRVTLRWTYARWVLVGLLIVGALLGGRLWLGHNNSISQEAKQKQTQAKPSFAPLKPAGNEVQVNKSAVYNTQKQVYTFQDSYQGVSMVVSEQAITAAVRDNPDTIKKAAALIGATDSFDTVNGTVYVSTADKGGTQRLVLIHRQLLIFISSDGTLDNPTWAEYIQALN